MALELYRRLNTRSNKVYIYGAGIVAYYLAKDILAETDYEIVAFLVTRAKGSPSDYFNIPVKQYCDVDVGNDCIIVGVLERTQAEIISYLENNGHRNIYAISDVEYNCLRRKYLDLSGEENRLLRNISTLLHWNRCETSTRADINTIRADISTMRENNNKKIKSVFDYIKYTNNSPISNEAERIRYSVAFAELVANQEEYKEKINKLIAGLDLESRETIYKILDRLNRMIEGKMYVYDESEKKAVQLLEEHFYPHIYKLAENYYVYNNYFLPKNKYEASVFWYEHGISKLSNLEYIRGKDVIDAGAYIGESALVLSKYTNGKIYSFEAVKENYQYIEKTIQMNNLNGVVPVNMALSDVSGNEEIYISRAETCNSLIADGVLTFETNERQVVECITIDEYVKTNNLQVGLIKADVEGAEQRLLNGAIETIKEQKPTLLISIYHSINDFFSIKVWLDELKLGYKFCVFRPILRDNFMLETVLIAEVMI